jgi:hypothetical protein
VIIRKLKQEITVRLWRTQKEYLKKYYWTEHTLWLDRYFASSIGNVSEVQPKITYGTRVGVDAYSHWAEGPVVLRFILLK